ncbi:unnamed protein product [Paramecium octaurelia]|uniref:Uncharacterized protein n=1 Tax=Paramecium octaurelia TaxID=43137 RepID=A0A8S1W1I8_PAROT|nr:unnamed protein product [Paramecium octaurelia]
MYTLINELWNAQQSNPFQLSIHIPQTIIINQGFKIQWYFSQNNKILKRKSINCNIPSIISYLKQNNTPMNIITISSPYVVEGFGQIQLKNEPIAIEQIQQLLIHYQTYPHIIENPIILQEHFQLGQHISLKWNKNYTFIQECDSHSYQVNQQCLKLTPHYRSQINMLSQQLVQRIQQIYQVRGQLSEMNIVMCLQDKPIFLWCTEIKFINDQYVRQEDDQFRLWNRIKEFRLTFNPITKHHRCQSNLEGQAINQSQQNDNLNKSTLYLNLNGLISNRAHNVSVTSNVSNSKQHIQPLFTQMKSARSNITSNININVKQLLHNNNHNQSQELSTQRQSRGGSVLKQLTNRSFSNRSQSMYKVHLNDDKIQQCGNQKKNGSMTQRTEASEQELLLQPKITKSSSKVVNCLRQRLQEIKLKQLL